MSIHCTKTDEARVYALLRRKWATVRQVAEATGYLYTSQRVSEWLAEGVKVMKREVTAPNGRKVMSYRIVGGAK